MRKRIFNFAVLAAAAGILAACSSFEEIPTVAGVDQAAAQAVDSITVTFTATFEQPEDTTRTSLVDSHGKVKWSTKDKIGVFARQTKQSKTDIYTTLYTSSEATSTDYLINFFVNIPKPTGGYVNADYYAIYPVKEASANNGKFSTALATEQTATAGTFADNVNISAAKSNDKNEFHFQNLCALLSFTVDTNTDIVSATLTSNSGIAMSGGTATIDFSGDNPTMALSDPNDPNYSNYSTSVKLTGNIEQGKQYYFVVYPGDHEKGFTLEFEDKDGRVALLSSEKDLKLESRSNFYLGTIKIDDSQWDAFDVSKRVGIFDLSENVQYAYRPYYDQLVWSVKSSVNSFRIQDIVSRNYLSISGLPASFEKGKSYNVTVHQNYLTSEAETYEDELTVFNESNGYVRLVGKNHKYIIKTK